MVSTVPLGLRASVVRVVGPIPTPPRVTIMPGTAAAGRKLAALTKAVSEGTVTEATLKLTEMVRGLLEAPLEETATVPL